MHPSLKNLPLLLGRGVAAVSALALLVSGSVAATWFIAEHRKPDKTSTSSRTPSDAEKTAITKSFLGLPLSFEANRGQTDRVVDFISRGAGQTTFLTKSEAVFALRQVEGSGRPGAGDSKVNEAVVRLQLMGSNPKATVKGRDALKGKVNYFIGKDPKKWQTNVGTFGKVAYGGIYPGIDLVYHGTQGQLEYDFVVAPGADPNAIGLRIVGGDTVAIDDRGDLVVSTSAGDLRQAKPTVFQEIGGTKRPVDGTFVMRGDREVAFLLGSYDPAYRLVIDPTLAYSTMIGGAANDFGFGIALDSSGMVYLGGQTASATFPRGGAGDLTPLGAANSFDTTKSGGSDAYALKFDPNATTANGDATASQGALVWAAYLGGSQNDAGYDLRLNNTDDVFLAGVTQSADFPTMNAYDTTCGNAGGICATQPADTPIPSDAFVAKISNDGSSLLYSTYLGGDAEEQSPEDIPYSAFMGLAVSGSKAYVTSLTFSADFPVAGKAFQGSCGSCSNGLSDTFVSVIDTNVVGAAGLVFSSFLGGRATEEGKGIAVDDAGDIYLTGHTFDNAENAQGNPTNNNFRVRNAYQSTYRGGYSDAYVAKVNPNATKTSKSLVWSTFLGGGGTEEGWDIAVKPGTTEAYVTGYTTSGPNPNPQVNDPDHPGACAAAPVDVDPDPSVTTLVRLWCDYAPDPVPHFPNSWPATHPFQGRVSTESGSALFYDGDAFVVKLTSAGQLAWSRLIGGKNADYGQAIALDADDRVYVAGWTTCRHSFNDLLAQFFVNAAPANGPPPTGFDGDHPATVPEGVPSGRNPGSATQTTVPDCPGGSFENVSGMQSLSIDGRVRLMDAPTGYFVARLASDGDNLEYATLLDGAGFDRGFALAVRDPASGDPEAYVTGRIGNNPCPKAAQTADSPNRPAVPAEACGSAGPFPTTANAYDSTYNGGGRDTSISKIVG